ncbi:hypothetical protein [Bacillus phage YungSlug]|nr:hypothetical protein [Bacillus phage YungSlug]
MERMTVENSDLLKNAPTFDLTAIKEGVAVKVDSKGARKYVNNSYVWYGLVQYVTELKVTILDSSTKSHDITISDILRGDYSFIKVS